MVNRALLCLVVFAAPFLVRAQEPAPQPQAQPAAPTASDQQKPVTPEEPIPTNFTSSKGFVLEDATPLKLRINRNISSADAHVGDTVDFEVLQDVSVNGTLVIPKGSLAYATVTEAQAKRRMARGGKLSVNIDYVKLADSEKAPLRAIKEVKGGGHTGAMTAGIVATGIVFFPAAPFFLFMHGKDITIPKGTEIVAYVNGDMRLELVKFQHNATDHPPLEGSSPAALMTAPASAAKIQLESTPPGADIELDGSFVGSTPSDLIVAEGDHEVTVKKSGFKNWQRKVKVSAGSSVHLAVEMERSETQ